MAKNVFNSVQYPKVGSNTFDLSHDVKMSFRMGGLYPTVVMDCLPGDRIRLSSETMLRFAPLLSPVMHRVNVTTHYFFVPNRILWPQWEDWITGNLDVVPPYWEVATGGIQEGTLADYMGLPTGNPDMEDMQISALPFAAYRKIWNEYYRDQNLQNELDDVLNSGANLGYDIHSSQGVQSRAWMHDYFTASLPFAQKGDAVTLPLLNPGGTLPVNYSFDASQPLWRYSLGPTHFPVDEPGGLGDSVIRADDDGTGNIVVSNATGTNLSGVGFDPNGSLVVDASSFDAEAATINSLRRAFRLQEWLEKNARGGTRYVENIMAHFGVKSSDARLQRPEFLGGSYQKMVISEVLSTAETEVPVGQMAGHGISVGSGREFTYRCEEHGWIIGIINVQPVTAYQQGIDRKFSRIDRLDYFWPSFAQIGEQEVLNKELYVSDDPVYNEGTFGYVPRYAEYRFINSRVAGEMRDSLAYWHLGRIFETEPNLNSAFITANPSTRIFAVTGDQDTIYSHIYNNIRAVRKIPKYGTPSF